MTAVPDREHATLLLDLFQQNATLQSSINVLIASAGRAEKDREEIKEQVKTINGRLTKLELAKARLEGGAIAVRMMWMALAGAIGAGTTWVVSKMGAG